MTSTTYYHYLYDLYTYHCHHHYHYHYHNLYYNGSDEELAPQVLHQLGGGGRCRSRLAAATDVAATTGH